jgi:hypothetical protein
MLSARQRALDAIKVGDVVYGISGNGNGKLLLVYESSDDSFFARHITSQTSAKFRRDGVTVRVPTGGSCTIYSTAGLPDDQYQVAIGLDRKTRAGKKYPDFVLSEDEKRLILSYDDFYKAHPLPGE